MTHAFDDARRWQQEGTTLLLDAASSLGEPALEEPSLLPGWSRKHLLAHVAANADALQNLVHWAATGERTPMYASSEARAEGIERGAELAADELLAWLRGSAEKLEEGMAALTDEQWQTTVVTAQGRAVPATETPWMRAREVFVHAVDLAAPDDRAGVRFADLPTDFLEALVEDIRRKRDLADDRLPDGPLPDIAAWLAGRSHDLSHAPELGPWL